MSCNTTETEGTVGRYDGMVIPADTDWMIIFTLLGPDGVTATNLTGYTARAVMQAPGQTSIELTTANSRIALGGSAGTITLTLNAATTATMAATVYGFGLDLINGASQKTRILEGDITVTADTTPTV
jgi:tRNA threonylcarbamoyladenosine modification (KEOPS) complex  Pcc1 subunit